MVNEAGIEAMKAKSSIAYIQWLGKSSVACMVLFLALPANTGAFSTVAAHTTFSRSRYYYDQAVCPLAATSQDNKNGRRMKTAPIYALDTKAVAEVIPDTTILPTELEFSENAGMKPHEFFSSFQVQLRSLDRDTMINVSIIVVAVVTVAIQVFSINTGITRGWNPEEIAYRVPIDNWRSYNDILNMSPIQTKAVTSATVYTIGDIIAQRTEGIEVGELDRGRIARSLAAGLIGHGPLSHVWYQVSEDFFENVMQWTEWWSFVPKVVVDQTFWGPFWNNTYILLLGVMQFQKPSQIWSDVKRTTIPLIISGLKLWPLAHCVTYGLVPVENRLLWVDLVEIVWVTILASQASGAAEDDKATAHDEVVNA